VHLRNLLKSGVDPFPSGRTITNYNLSPGYWSKSGHCLVFAIEGLTRKPPDGYIQKIMKPLAV